MIPQLDLAGARRAHAALCTEVSGLTDEQARRPSLLAGWTVGHVLTHLARNADSFTGLFTSAQQGEVADQYPGGDEQRDHDIATGAARSAAALVDDLVAACRRLEDAWTGTSEQAWATGIGRTRQGELGLAAIVVRRWREVEVHHADLGLGFSWHDWSDDYVNLELELSANRLAPRLAGAIALRLEPTDAVGVWIIEAAPVERTLVRGTRHELLAWILGRYDRPDWPQLAPW